MPKEGMATVHIEDSSFVGECDFFVYGPTDFINAVMRSIGYSPTRTRIIKADSELVTLDVFATHTAKGLAIKQKQDDESHIVRGSE